MNTKKLEKKNQATKIHITNHTKGTKMDLMQSISTSCLACGRCRKRAANPDTICSHCYAERSIKQYTNLGTALEHNTKVLTAKVLPKEELPTINCAFFRFEAFGDLNNTIQVINYFNICKKNPYVNFALWTKNPDFIDNAIKKGHEKPDNLQIVYSGVFTDKVNKIPTKYAYFIDKIFNVFSTEETAAACGKAANCGKKHCIDCLLCYTKNNVKEINELLK